MCKMILGMALFLVFQPALAEPEPDSNAPVITSNGGGATAAVNSAENQTAVTTVTATDADAGSALTYSISGGADAAKFAIDGSTGVLTFIAAPDYEAPTDADANNVYDVTVQVSDGTLTDTQDIAVTAVDDCAGVPQPEESRTVACPVGYTSSWTQTRSVISTDYPQCWIVSEWDPRIDPLGACTLILPVLPPTSKPVLSISPNGRYFRLDGQPYFWVADTAWYLNGYPAGYFEDEATELLEHRAARGVKVVQSGLITSEDTQPPYDGGPDDPFIDSVPMVLNEDYWAKVDHLARETGGLGMIFSIAPVWGSSNDVVFPDADRHVEFVTLIAKRYSTQAHVVWIGAGEYQKITYTGTTGPGTALTEEQKLRYSRIVDAIRANAHPDSLITFHPDGGKRTSIDWQSNAIVQFNMHQAYSNIKAVIRDIPLERAATPPKPVVEAEAYYEDVPPPTVSSPWHIRMAAYHTAMLGGAGYTYGSDLIWDHTANWQSMINAEGGEDVFKNYQSFMLLIHNEGNVPATGYIIDTGDSSSTDSNSYASALRSSDKLRLYAYVSNGRSFKIKTSLLAPGIIKGKWYDPRLGEFRPEFNVTRGSSVLLNPPGSPIKNNDWALVLAVTPSVAGSR